MIIPGFIPSGPTFFSPSGLGTDGQFLRTNGDGTTSWDDVASGVSDHGELTGLTDDDHGQYFKVTGRSGEALTLTGSTSGTAVIEPLSTGALVVGSNSSYLALRSDGAERWYVLGGNFLAGLDGAYDIGAAAANRPRSGYFANSLVTGGGAAGTIPLLTKGAASQTAVMHQFQGISSTAAVREMLDIDTAWATSTDASRKARAIFRVWDTAAREFMRAEATGSGVIVLMTGMPTADPAVAGALWNDSGTVKISAG